MNRPRIGSLLVAGLASVGLAVSAPAGPGAAAGAGSCQPQSHSAKQDCLARLTLRSGARLPYYGSYPLSGSPTPTGAVVVVHGTGRNARGYFDRMVSAAQKFGPRAEIIAPWFQTGDNHPAAGDAYWTNGGAGSWKDGGGAVKPAGLSSFETVDEILGALADKKRFPHLTRITIVGHSAGGQFVQRYAAGGRAPAEIKGVTFNFVSANPSSYLYLDSKRPAGNGLPGSCPGYDNYKYGMKHRNAYMAKPTDQQLRTQYTGRPVTYLLGEADVKQDHGIDTSCEAKAQGPNRFQRGRSYYSTIHQNYPSAPHKMVTVPKVGHDSNAMFNSTQGKAAIFNGW